MKVILSVEALGPVLTGIGRYTFELVSRLQQQPSLSQLRYYRNGAWVKDPYQFLEKEINHTHKPLRVQMPKWITTSTSKWKCYNQLFHGPNFFLPPCVDIGVATIHDLSVFKFPETHPIERIKQFEQHFHRSMLHATHLITDSETTRHEVIDYLGWPTEKITAVPLGVSKKFKPLAATNIALSLRKYGLIPGKYTLCVSTLEPRKKINNLLQAYQCLSQAIRTRYPLVLIGSTGWLSESLHKEIQRLSQQGWVKYFGFIDEVDLPVLYAGAKAFLYPSIYEGFGLPVLEAMASGVPVVTSNSSSLPEVTKGVALLTDPNNIDVLAETIQTALFDETWRTIAIDKGLSIAQEFSWERCIENTVSVYKRILH